VQRRNVAYALAGITLVALVVRLWNLGSMGLWTDEAYSFHVAHRATVAGVLSDQDQTPPLFVLLLHYWMMIFGTSTAAVRMMSVLAGVGAVPILYFVATRFASARASLLAASTAALAVYFVIISQEARAFALLLLLSCASMLALLRLLEKPSLRRAAVYIVLTALMLYSHLWGIFFLMAQNLYVLVGRTPIGPWWRPRWLGIQAAIGLLFLPWLPSLLLATQRVSGHFWIEAPGWDDVYWSIYDLSNGHLDVIVAPLLLVLAVATLRRWKTDEARKDALLWAWLAVPVVVPFLFSFWHPIFTPKYVVTAAAPVQVLVAKSLDRLLPNPRRFTAAATALVAVSALLVVAFFGTGQGLDSRQDWTSTMALVEGQAAPGAVVLFNKGYCDSASDRDLACSWEIYQKRSDLRLVPFFFEEKGVSPAVNATSVAQLDGLVAAAPQVWLVESYPSDVDHLIPGQLEHAGFHEAGHWNFKKVEVARFDA